MKKYLFIFSLCFLIPRTWSQVVFCPAGAEWHYTFYEHNGNYYNEEVKYIGDSIVGNELVKVLQHVHSGKVENGFFGVLSFVKQKGDTVFFRSPTTLNNWQILYNYAALPGQSWQNTICISNTNPTTLTATYTVNVISITYTTINSYVLRQLHVNYHSQFVPSQPGYESVIINERFGCDQFMFNFYFQVTQHIFFEKFLCYEDDSFGLKQFTDKPCNYVDYVGIGQYYFKSDNIKIYPNPANDFFTVDTENELVNGEFIVNIKDLCGREVKQITLSNLNSDVNKVKIGDLANGIYILSLKNGGREIYTGKLVKAGL